MTREELRIQACQYAIGELTRKGSSAFITSAYEGRQQISWVEVVEWLKDYKRLLEQEPCKDAVSRQSVLNTLDKRFDSIPVGQTTEILLLRKDLRELPSVIPYKVDSEED